MNEISENAVAATPFFVNDDLSANKAVKKIKRARDEYNRLMAIAEAEEWEIMQRKTEIKAKYEQETAYLKSELYAYMQTVPCKKTKTQSTYELLDGKLVDKMGGPEYKRNDEAVMDWLKTRPDGDRFIERRESLKWAELKKELTIVEGMAVTEDGEIIPGITVENKPNTFDVKL